MNALGTRWLKPNLSVGAHSQLAAWRLKQPNALSCKRKLGWSKTPQSYSISFSLVEEVSDIECRKYITKHFENISPDSDFVTTTNSKKHAVKVTTAAASQYTDPLKV